MRLNQAILAGLAAALFITPATAGAESKAVINGVDTRVPALQLQYLKAEEADRAETAANLAALLQIEKHDHAATKKALDDANDKIKWWENPQNRAWIDVPQAKYTTRKR